ncbi:MAG: B12-binding domain-containing radical SAM protein [Candidatus Omnitrophica bacterium]|nr:B12-binding domain-containing radical SAM protein [Candidatus Omnitrophota bacterium]
MEPLPSAYLSALVPEDMDVRFYDDRMESIPYNEQTDLVLISVETYTAKRAYQIASEYHRRGVRVFMGGYHATLLTDEVLQYADAVVVGEGEESVPVLMADFKANRLKRIYSSSGANGLKTVSPDRRIFSGKRYLDIGLIEVTRGCRSHCEFCSITAFHRGKHSHRRIEMLMKEIDTLKSSKKLFFFVDDNFTADVTFAKEFCRALIPLHIKWVGQASITLALDGEMMSLMRASGCQGVLIGFESLNPQNLKAMNKRFNYTNIKYEEAIQRLNAYTLRLYATFVFGYDYDVIDDFKRTLDFCVQHKIFMAAFNHLTPFPGTPVYEKLEKEGRLLYKKWWLDDRYRYGEVPFKTVIAPDVIKKECVKARKSFYGVPSIAKRMFNRSNCGNLLMFNAYWFINFLLRKEAEQRIDYPLGDLSFKGDLITVRDKERENVLVA